MIVPTKKFFFERKSLKIFAKVCGSDIREGGGERRESGQLFSGFDRR